MSQSITIKGSSREFLDQCLAEGLLTDEAAKRAEKVLAENSALRRENALLSGRLAEVRKVNKEYRIMYLAALEHQQDGRIAAHQRRVLLAVVGITIALTCLACSLAMCL
jgi:hypothetical protein